MKVNAKGQVTIPLALRQKSGIVPGSEVEFFEEQGRLYIEKVEGIGRGDGLVTRMRGRGTVTMSTDEILALTRGEG
ncbi:MAG: AbrB/MazE/SpoVT family DNA-binding domain-containing protein [Phycisphaerae bacterium]|jgi:AbrB family looped-hinge helix DNA binding protein|nr:AbrB/MazE/SpoVT family DNA-binding domain-containing protein [Phycisphaerae bacterium]